MKPKVIVIVGPTASGKTSLSIELAKQIKGEIISCELYANIIKIWIYVQQSLQKKKCKE